MNFSNKTFSVWFNNFYTTKFWMSEIGLFRGFLYKHFIVQEKKYESCVKLMYRLLLKLVYKDFLYRFFSKTH